MASHPSRSRAADARAVERLIEAAQRWAKAAEIVGHLAAGAATSDTLRRAGGALACVETEFMAACKAARARFRPADEPARIAPEDA